MLKNVNLLIKPASSLCDLRCRYCFYEDVSENRAVKNQGRMTHETAYALIRAAFAAVDGQGAVSFAFQGGEPTMAGLAFYRDFTALVNASRPLGVRVSYALQTNGMLLDEKWARFLKENGFMVGVSVDGYRELHDHYRLDAKGNTTYSRAAKAAALLQKQGVATNLLCVVTGQCAKHPQKAYDALKKLGIRYLQFIPCLDPLAGERGTAPFSLTPQLYGDFLCGLFDLWYRDWETGNYTSVRLFDDYVHLLMGFPASTCATMGDCGNCLVVEGDGGIYPCDFYVLDPWKLGNVQDGKLEQLNRSALALRFLQEGNDRPAACAHCRWKPLCNGGCRRDRISTPNGVENYYCASFQRFFAYAGSRLNRIAQCERRSMV